MDAHYNMTHYWLHCMVKESGR